MFRNENSNKKIVPTITHLLDWFSSIEEKVGDLICVLFNPHIVQT